MQTPPGLPAALFDARADAVASGIGAYAATLRMYARQQPEISAAERRTLDRLSTSLRAAEEVLATWSACANQRAFAVVERMPVRACLVAMVHHKQPEQRAMCISETYDRMLLMRQDMRLRHPETYLRLNEAILFYESQDEVRACLQAHKIAELVPELEHLMPAGGRCCCFRLRGAI